MVGRTTDSSILVGLHSGWLHTEAVTCSGACSRCSGTLVVVVVVVVVVAECVVNVGARHRAVVVAVQRQHPINHYTHNSTYRGGAALVRSVMRSVVSVRPSVSTLAFEPTGPHILHGYGS